MKQEKLPEIVEVELDDVLDSTYYAGYDCSPRPWHKIDRLKSIILAELNKSQKQKEGE